MSSKSAWGLSEATLRSHAAAAPQLSREAIALGRGEDPRLVSPAVLSALRGPASVTLDRYIADCHEAVQVWQFCVQLRRSLEGLRDEAAALVTTACKAGTSAGSVASVRALRDKLVSVGGQLRQAALQASACKSPATSNGATTTEASKAAVMQAPPWPIALVAELFQPVQLLLKTFEVPMELVAHESFVPLDSSAAVGQGCPCGRPDRPACCSPPSHALWSLTGSILAASPGAPQGGPRGKDSALGDKVDTRLSVGEASAQAALWCARGLACMRCCCGEGAALPGPLLLAGRHFDKALALLLTAGVRRLPPCGLALRPATYLEPDASLHPDHLTDAWVAAGGPAATSRLTNEWTSLSLSEGLRRVMSAAVPAVLLPRRDPRAGAPSPSPSSPCSHSHAEGGGHSHGAPGSDGCAHGCGSASPAPQLLPFELAGVAPLAAVAAGLKLASLDGLAAAAAATEGGAAKGLSTSHPASTQHAAHEALQGFDTASTLLYEGYGDASARACVAGLRAVFSCVASAGTEPEAGDALSQLLKHTLQQFFDASGLGDHAPPVPLPLPPAATCLQLALEAAAALCNLLTACSLKAGSSWSLASTGVGSGADLPRLFFAAAAAVQALTAQVPAAAAAAGGAPLPPATQACLLLWEATAVCHLAQATVRGAGLYLSCAPGNAVIRAALVGVPGLIRAAQQLLPLTGAGESHGSDSNSSNSASSNFGSRPLEEPVVLLLPATAAGVAACARAAAGLAAKATALAGLMTKL